MSRTRQVVALITLLMGSAHSFTWDVVVAAQNKLEFYNNGGISHVEELNSDLAIEHLAYDVVHNRLLLHDRKVNGATFIYSFNVATKEILPIVKRSFEGRFHQSMYNMAYDPVTEKIFWTDGFSIYWFSLKPAFENNVNGNVLLELDSLPYAIAVDSCKGYIYWSNVHDVEPCTIEKARLDGSGREIVLDANMLAIRNLVIDQQTQKMFWTDILQRPPTRITKFSVHSANLNGENKTTLYVDTEKNEPEALAVSKNSIYWVPSFDLTNKIYQLPKNPTDNTNPTAISVSGWYSDSLATNYDIEHQIEGIQDCEPLRSLLPKSSVTNE